MKKLSVKILVPFLTLIVLIGGTLSYMGFHFTKKTTTKELIVSMGSTTKVANQSFEAFFKGIEQDANQLAGMPIFEKGMDKPPAQLQSEMKDLMLSITETNESVTAVYFANEKGETIFPDQLLTLKELDPRERPWYKGAVKQKGKVAWTEPYEDAITKQVMVSGSKAIYKNEQLVGVLSVDVSLENLSNIIKNIKLGETGYAFLLDTKGKVVAHPDNKLLGKDLSKESFYTDMKKLGTHGSLAHDFGGEEEHMAFTQNKETGWILGISIKDQELISKSSKVILPMLLIMGVVLLIAAVVTYLVSNSITKPIRYLSVLMKKVETGDFTVKSDLSLEDEVGQLSNSFNQMVQHMRHMVEEVKSTSLKVSEASDFLKVSTQEQHAVSSEVATTIESLAGGATQQAEIIQTYVESVQELDKQIQEVESQSQQMQDQANVMLEATSTGSAKMELLKEKSQATTLHTEQALESIQRLEKSSRSIEEIIDTIKDVADKTNVLSINAAITAAHAGEAGKGFAVVADEVRKLALRTQEALNQVSQMVKAIQKETQEAASYVRQTNENMKEQESTVEETEVAFGSIVSSIDQNQSRIAQVVVSVEQMLAGKEVMGELIQEIAAISQESAAGTEEVAASVEEQTVSMEELSKLAQNLQSHASSLKEDFDKFKME